MNIEAVEALDRLTQIALDNTSEDAHEAVYEDAKRVRAEWQAPRKVEAAPSDTEPLTLWRVQYEDQGRDCDGTYPLTPHYVLAPHEDEAWNRADDQFDTSEGCASIGVYDARPATEAEASEWLASRTAQPVQVEVTEVHKQLMRSNIRNAVQREMGCERRAHYGNVEHPFCGEHGHLGQWPCPVSEAVTSAALVAVLGGDE